MKRKYFFFDALEDIMVDMIEGVQSPPPPHSGDYISLVPTIAAEGLLSG